MTQRWTQSAHYENGLYDRSLAALNGQGVKQDHAAAFALNAEAAELGHHDAILAMGWFYLNGVGVEVDFEKSRHWYQKSARHKEPRAMFSLGVISWFEGSYLDANTWFSRAARAGHLRSEYWLAKLLWKGRGVPQDRKRAWSLIEKAARGHVYEARRALRFLSRR